MLSRIKNLKGEILEPRHYWTVPVSFVDFGTCLVWCSHDVSKVPDMPFPIPRPSMISLKLGPCPLFVYIWKSACVCTVQFANLVPQKG